MTLIYKYFIPFLLLGISQVAWSKLSDTTNYFGFQKLKNANRVIKYKLPQKCRIYLRGDEKRFGKIVDLNDSILYFEYKDYDTSDVNEILTQDLKRKERDERIDSLIDSSKVIQEIPLDSLTQVAILSRDAKIMRKVGMLIASLTFMGSGAVLMTRQSNNVGQSFQKLDWALLGGMVTSVGIIAILTRKVFDFEKWQLIKIEYKS